MELVTTVLAATEPRLAITQGGAQPLQMTDQHTASPCTLCRKKAKEGFTGLWCDAPARPVVVRAEAGHESDPRTLVVLESPKASGDSLSWIVRDLRVHTKGLIVFDYAVRHPLGHKEFKSGPMGHCLPYLKQTLLDLQPTFVVTYDTYAAAAVAGFSVPVHSNEGLWAYWAGPWGPVWFSFQMSPSTARQAPSTYGEMVRRGLALMYSRPRPATVDGLSVVRLHRDTLCIFKEWYENLPADAVMRVDLETYGNAFNKDHDIDAIGLSVPDSEVVFVASRFDMQVPEVRSAVAQVLTSGPPKTGWNAVFDLMGLKSAWDIDPYPIAGDDMALYKLNDVERTATLEAAALQVGIAGHKKEAHDAVKAEAKRISASVKAEGLAVGRAGVKAYAYRAIPEHIQLPYVGADSWTSGAVAAWQARNTRQELQGTWQRFGAAGTRALYKLGVQGFRLDLSKYNTVNLQLQEELRKAEHKLKSIPFSVLDAKGEPVRDKTGAEIPWYSTDTGVRAYLETQDADTGVRTSTDIMSVGAGALKRLHHMDFVAPLLEYRHVVKLISTYVEGLPYFLRDDGKAHTVYKLSGARSGRLSTTAPSLHQIPSRTSLGKLVKSWFVPDAGYILISADYKTLEVMIAANYSQDDVLLRTLEDVAAGRLEDLHLQTAMKIGQTAWGLSPAEVVARHKAGNTMYRTAAKSTMFGILYQMGANKLAEQIHCSKRQAELVIESFYETYPGLRQSVDSTIAQAVASAEAWAYWDGEKSRMRRLSDVGYSSRDSRRLKGERIAFNHPIQSQASDICLMSVIQIQDMWEAAKADRYVLGTVHDSIIAMCRPYDLHKAVAEMREVMTSQPTYPLKLLVDIDVGYSWGSVKAYNPELSV